MDIQHRHFYGVAAAIQRHLLTQNRWLELKSANADDLQAKAVAHPFPFLKTGGPKILAPNGKITNAIPKVFRWNIPAVILDLGIPKPIQIRSQSRQAAFVCLCRFLKQRRSLKEGMFQLKPMIRHGRTRKGGPSLCGRCSLPTKSDAVRCATSNSDVLLQREIRYFLVLLPQSKYCWLYFT